jgi:hypothetical protein
VDDNFEYIILENLAIVEKQNTLYRRIRHTTPTIQKFQPPTHILWEARIITLWYTIALCTSIRNAPFKAGNNWNETNRRRYYKTLKAFDFKVGIWNEIDRRRPLNRFHKIIFFDFLVSPTVS